MSELDSRIKALAQELQDLILDFTLIASFKPTHQGDVVRLGFDDRYGTPYKPPWQLSVDRRSRKEFATWYYGENIFYLPWSYEGYAD
ncbi:hypothetical protein Slin15195_G100030 [Septoria linicola]|uniref:Uncharacterized protein n=1 Tax=Septoria linicola TaxID=215465 RepID=A0A9Q9ENK3_9PEZI|nr:hypothetical protein Slin15195_G100030 [Septoria linicola]